MTNMSNRDLQRLYDKWNPNGVQTGDRVLVNLHNRQYFARIVGLDLDIKNEKVYANLRLMDNQSYGHCPTRVDVQDCSRTLNGVDPLYPGHHNNK